MEREGTQRKAHAGSSASPSPTTLLVPVHRWAIAAALLRLVRCMTSSIYDKRMLPGRCSRGVYVEAAKLGSGGDRNRPLERPEVGPLPPAIAARPVFSALVLVVVEAHPDGLHRYIRTFDHVALRHLARSALPLQRPSRLASCPARPILTKARTQRPLRDPESCRACLCAARHAKRRANLRPSLWLEGAAHH
jgi:hypothetical protein